MVRLVIYLWNVQLSVDKGFIMTSYDFNAVVSMVGTFGGQTAFNEFLYTREAVEPTANSQAVCQGFYDDVWSVFKLAMHEDYLLQEIRCKIFQNPPSQNKPEYIMAVNESGTVVGGDSMPPNVTATILKQPDNTTLDPPGEPNMRVGKNGFSGVPESQQDAGLLTPAAITLWNTAGEALENFLADFGGGDLTLTLTILRDYDTLKGAVPPNPITKCYVAETYVRQALGTNNSRKR